MGDGLFEAFIYLLAALVAVPLAKRLGLGSVIGYLVAGAERAKLFILPIDDEAKGLEIIETVQREFPRLKILARATSRQHAYEILRLGVNQVYRETLGMDERRARRVAEIFREHDEASVRDMARLEDVDDAYVSIARKHVENLERALQSDAEMQPDPSAQDQAAALRSTI